MKDKSEDLHIPLVEKLKSIPETFGIRLNEEPEYDILKEDHSFEIRHYLKQLRAQITIHAQSFDEFREAAFKKLAAYIFGDNREEKTVSMTSPVLEQQEEDGVWSMSFILPSHYTLQTAPTPNDSAIKLIEVAPYDAAIMIYSGNNTLEKIKSHEKDLMKWLKAQPNFERIGNYTMAQYDAPFVIPFMKKNEIHLQVKTLH